jgi:fructokinase
MATAISFGELLVDMVSPTDTSLGEATTFLKAPGGAPANVAVGLARLGVQTAFMGMVGNDPFGHWLNDTINREGVDTSHLFQHPTARTTIAFVATRRDGKKDICFYRNPGADAQFSPADVSTVLFDAPRVFHCGSVSLSLDPCRKAQIYAAHIARERGALISFDPNWRPSLWDDFDLARERIWDMISRSDIVKIAYEEWEFITQTPDLAAGAEKIRAQGPKLVVVTRGENGAYFNCEGACGDVSGFKAKAIDTLGAGDAFVAGLLSSLLEFKTLQEALNQEDLAAILRFANACGALATQTAGAIPALPSTEQIHQFLELNS